MKRTLGLTIIVATPLVLLLGVVFNPIQRSHSTSLSNAGKEQRIDKPFASYGERLSAFAQPIAELILQQRRVLAAAAIGNADRSQDLALLSARVTTVGLGPIDVGMTLEEAAQAGITLEPIDSESRGECRYYRVKNLMEPLGFMVVHGRIIRIDVWPGSPIETLSGIKIGSHEKAVSELFQDRIKAAPNPITQGKLLTFTPSDPAEALHRIVFETDAEGTVVQYRTGQFPAVTWQGGCL